MSNFYGATGDWQIGMAGADNDPPADAGENAAAPPLPDSNTLALGFGTSGCAVVQNAAAYAARANRGLATGYFDYAQPPMTALETRAVSGNIRIDPAPFCAIGDIGQRRDRIKAYPLLRERYDRLLRGTPVAEDRRLQLAGEGGGAIGPVTALDVDLKHEAIRAALNDMLRPLRGLAPAGAPSGSDFHTIAASELRQKQAASRASRIVCVFGATGATGNALSQLLPYFIRDWLREHGMMQTRLIGLAMGPHAYKNLTPYVMHNYRALMLSLEHMHKHGQRRDYVGYQVDIALPPYDDVLLFDDATLETDERGRVTEAALGGFHDRAARLLHLLLSSNVLERNGARDVNLHQRRDASATSGPLRWLTNVNLACATVDRQTMIEQATLSLGAALLRNVAARLAV
jgi:hypothetical protein